MDSKLVPLYERLVGSLGGFGSFVPTIAEKISIKISEQDLPALDAQLAEGEEAFRKGAEAFARARARIADRKLDAGEMAETILDCERLADEFEDLFTGHDEDKAAGSDGVPG